MKRRLKVAGVTLVMAVVIGTTAASAQALEWIVEPPLKLNEKHPVTCKGKGPMEIESIVAGAAVDLEFSQLKCSENWVIWNTKGATEVEAYSLGKLELSEGIVVGHEATCQIPAGKVTTGELTGHAGIFAALETHTGVTYKAPVGELIAEFKVEAKVGQKCPLAGTYQLKGMDVAEVPEVNELEPNPIAYRFNLAIEKRSANA